MILSQDWLWDRKISVNAAKAILKNPQNKHFLSLSSALLSRKNTPKEVFKYYLKPNDFILNWNRIKRQMRKNAWNDPRIEFWQAIYEKLKENNKFKKEAVPKIERSVKSEVMLFSEIADRIKAIRKLRGLSQGALARKLKVSQQVISRIESGRENISLNSLKKVADGLNAKLTVDISEK